MSEMFRQVEGPGIVRRGAGEKAEVENPSPASGGGMAAPIMPVWKGLVDNTHFQREMAEGIRAEGRMAAMLERPKAARGTTAVERETAAAKPPKIGVGEGWLEIGGQKANAEDFLDDPEVGGFAAESLWKRDTTRLGNEIERRKLELRDPSLARLSETERMGMSVEMEMEATSPERRKEIEARLAGAGDYDARRKEVFEMEREHLALRQGGVDEWRKRRLQADAPAIREQSAAKREEVSRALESAKADENALLQQIFRGVAGRDLDEAKARLGEVSQARAQLEKAAAMPDRAMESLRRDGEAVSIAKRREVRAKTTDELVQKFQDAGAFPSLTLALQDSGAWDKRLEKKNGRWLTPDLTVEGTPEEEAEKGVLRKGWEALGNAVRGPANKFGKQTDAWSDMIETVQVENGLSDEDMKSAWEDMGIRYRTYKKGETLRVDSTGKIFLNNTTSDILNTEKAIEAIRTAKADQRWKIATLAELPRMQAEQAYSMLERYEAAAGAANFGGGVLGQPEYVISPSAWMRATKREKDVATPEGLAKLILDYENHMESQGFLRRLQQTVAGKIVGGVLKAEQTVGGLAAMGGVGGEGLREWLVESQEASQMIAGGAAMDLGVVGDAINEAPSLIMQIGAARLVGAGIGAGLTRVGAPAALVARVGPGVAFTSAGTQSAGLIYGQSIAEGDSHEVAKQKAGAAFLSTAVITSLFGVKRGGVERLAAARQYMDVTMGQLMREVREKGINPVRNQALRSWARGVLLEAGGEAAEEGIDEFLQSFITADSESNLADAWDNAVKAAKVGGVIGGAISVGSSLMPQGSTDAQLDRINAAVAAMEPSAGEVDPQEAAQAATMAPANDGVEGVAQAVLFAREAGAALEAAKESAAEAQTALDEFVAMGATPEQQIPLQEDLRKKSEEVAKIHRATGAMKIAGGNFSSLTSDERRSLGIGEDFALLQGKDLEAVGLAKPVVAMGEDGSPILTDGLVDSIRQSFPDHAGMIELSETDALLKAKERANATKERERKEKERKSQPKTAFRVTGIAGASVDVEAASEQEALSKAISDPSWPMGERADSAVKLGGGEKPAVTPQQQSPAATGTPTDSLPAGQSPTSGDVGDSPSKGKRVRKALAKARKMLGSDFKAIKTGRIQTTDAGVVEVNIEALEEEAARMGLNDNQTDAWIAKAIDEEIRHVAQHRAARALWESLGKPGEYEQWRDGYYGEMWQRDFVQAGRDADVVALYGEGLSSLPEWRRAFEGLRMISQKTATGSPTEVAALWSRLSAKMIAHIRAALKALKSMAADLSPAMRAEVDAIEAQLRRMEGSNDSKKNDGNRGKKPAAEQKGDGTSQKPGAGERPDRPGEAAEGGRAGSGEVGSIVQFQRNGKVVRGRVVGVADDGRLLVQAAAGVRPVLVERGELVGGGQEGETPPAANEAEGEEVADDIDKFAAAYSSYHLSRITREQAKGKQSAAYYDTQRAEWTADKVRDRVVEFLAVIDNKDVAKLVRYNNGMFDGFWKIFGLRTGIKVPSSQAAKSDMIRDYVGAEADDANAARIAEARRKKDEEQAAKDEEWRIKALASAAEAMIVRHEGKDMNGKEFADMMLADGWRVENVSSGPAPRYQLSKDGRSIKNSKGFSAINAYAREAQKGMPDPVSEEDAELDALPQEEKDAINSLFEFGGYKAPAPILSDEYAGPRFTYGFRNRPLSIGTAPKGFIVGSEGPPQGRARHGTIQYPRKLTEQEVYDFELVEMDGDVQSEIPNLPPFFAEAVAQAESARILGDLNAETLGEGARNITGLAAVEYQETVDKVRAAAEQNGWAWPNVLEKVRAQLGLNEDFAKDSTELDRLIKAKRKAAEKLRKARDGDAPPKPALTPEKEQARRDLFAAFDGIIDGLEAAPLGQDFTRRPPPDRLPAFQKAAMSLISAGVDSPASLAALLEEFAPGKFRPYSEFLWRQVNSFLMGSNQEVDWGGVYGNLVDATPQQDQIENVEQPDEQTQRDGNSGSPAANGAEESSEERPGETPDPSVDSGARSEDGDGGIRPGQPDGGGRGDLPGGTVPTGDGNAQGGRDNDGAPPGNREGRGDADRTGVRDGARPDVGSPEANFVIEDGFSMPKGEKARIAANIKAITLLRQIEAEGRNATAAEKAILAKYSGWGSFKNAFNKINQRKWVEINERINSTSEYYRDSIRSTEEYQELQAWREKWGELHDQLAEMLSDEEFRAMSKSIRNAHYTALPVIDAMWSMVRAMGFKGGKILETSAGAGYFVGRQPADLAGASQWSAVELDSITARVFSKLYPEARINGNSPDPGRNIEGQGFQKSKIPNNSMDLVIGNFPFAQDGPMEAVKEFGMKMNLHNYFFARSIDKLKPGGIVIAITSNSTMDNNLIQRELIAGKVELVSAIRLPNDAFKESAGTEVTTDIIILRKKDGSRDAVSESWINVESVGEDTVYVRRGGKTPHEFLSSIPADWTPLDSELREAWKEWRARRPKSGSKWDDLVAAIRERGYPPAQGIPFIVPMVVNEYFARNPENVIGRHALEGSMYRPGSYAVVSDGTNVESRLNEIANSLPKDIFGESAEINTSEEEIIEAGGNHREGSIVLENDQPYHVIKGQLIPVRWDLEYAEDFLPEDKAVKVIQKENPELHAEFEKNMDELSGKPLADWINDFLEEHIPAEAAQKIRQKIKKETDRRNKVFKSWVSVRNAARSLMDAELRGDPAAGLHRETLNRVYDEHVKEHGAFSARNRPGKPNPHRFLFDEDDSPLLESLEDEVLTGTDEKGRPIYRYEKRPIFTESMLASISPPSSAQDIKDAVGISMGYKGRISLPYMAELLKVSETEAEKQLVESGFAFKNPKSGLYETSDIYLSGEVRAKLREAQEADMMEPGSFTTNIEALKAIEPKNRPIQSISVVLGARWIPGVVYEKFGEEFLEMASPMIRYEPAVNLWQIRTEGERRRRGQKNPSAANPDYLGTDRMSAEEIFEAILNSREIRITKAGPTRGSVVLDAEATIEAQTKAQQMMDKFAEWVKTTKDQVEYDGVEMRVGQLAEREFNDKVAGLVTPTFTGEWVTLPGQSGEIWLKPHRRAVLARMLTMGYGMMAHGVGSGKTYNQIALAMELRRLGKARRPVTIVQNSTIRQFAASHMKAYPHAKILVADESNFSARKRARFLSKMATGDYDSIIMTHSNISQIGHDAQAIRNYMARAIGQLEEILASTESGSQEQGDIQEAIDRLNEKLERMLTKAMSRAGSILTWEELGVDALIVDEAHEFKNAPIITRKARIKNLPSGEASDRAVMMQIKAANVQSKTGGKNVFFATGTPITNTMAEAYTMLNFIAPTLLESKGIRNFDDFATMFGRTVTEPEATWRGEIELVERFAKFVNGPELVALIRSVFDVSLGNESMGLRVPRIKGGGPEMLIVEPTEASEIFNDWVIDTAAEFDAIENKRKAFQENPWMSAIPIMVMQAGMAQAIDPRLINPNAPDDPKSKVNQMVDRIWEIYQQGTERKTAQVVFTDLSNPFSTLLLKEFNGDPFEEYGTASPEMRALEEQIMSAPTETDSEKAAKKKLVARYNKLVEERFNLMDDIKEKLVAKGIPAGEILLAKSTLNKKKLQASFDKVNSGEIRVIIGSSARLGVGVNIQERLAAAHNLSPPRDFKPAMMEQRLGRILRQGNLHRDWADQAFVDVVEKISKQKFDAKKLEDRYEQAVDWLDKNGTEKMKDIARKAEAEFEIIVINYGLKYSMDSSVYSMMKAKQRFIDQVLMGENVMDEFDDPMSEESASFALMAAESMGDENLKRRVILDGELNKLTALRIGHYREIHNRENALENAQYQLGYYQRMDADGIRAEGKKFAGLYDRRTRTAKTTKGAMALLPGNEWSGKSLTPEQKKEQVEYQVKATLYAFGDKEIDTGKPDGKIITPLNEFIKDAMVDAKAAGDDQVVTRDITVNGERFSLVVRYQNWRGDTYSAKIAWPGKVAGRVVFEASVNVSGDSPAQSLLDGLRGLSSPDYAERYASSIEASIKQYEQQIKTLQPLVDNPPPFEHESEWREKSRELIDVNRRLAQANSDPRKHRYYRSLSRMVGVDATEQILGLDGKTGLPAISPDVWSRIFIRFRLERRLVDNIPAEIADYLRSVVERDVSQASLEAGETNEQAPPIAEPSIDTLDRPAPPTPPGFLFPSERYRKREGRLASLRKIAEKLQAKFDENDELPISQQEVLEKANKEIAEIERQKYQESMRGEARGLQAAPLDRRDAEYLRLAQDPENNREELQRMVDEAARAAGYDLSHREGYGQDWRKKQNVIQFADWRADGKARNEGNYGPANYLIRSKDLKPVPKWAINWHARDPYIIKMAKELGVSPRELAYEAMNPPDIVDGAGMWDDQNDVRRFWAENESRLMANETFGFLTPDGAVIFDPYTAAERGIAKLADPVTYDASGNVIPLSQRFNPESDSILQAAPLDRLAPLRGTPEQQAEITEQQEAFRRQGKVAGRPDLANPGMTESTREAMDLEDELRKDSARRESRSQWEEEGRRRAKNREAEIEMWVENAIKAEGLAGNDFERAAAAIAPEDVYAIRYIMEEMAQEAGGDKQKLADVALLRTAYRSARSNIARVMAAGTDWLKTPAQRNREAIFVLLTELPLREMAAIENRVYAKRQDKEDAVRKATIERLAQFEEKFAEMGITLEELLSGDVFLSLNATPLMERLMKGMQDAEAMAVKMMQQGAGTDAIRRRTHLNDAEIERVRAKMEKDLRAALYAKAAAGFRLEQLRASGDLKAAPLEPTQLTEEEIQAELDRIIRVGFGIPLEALPKKSGLPAKTKPVAKKHPRENDSEKPQIAAEAVVQRWIDRLAVSQSDTLSWQAPRVTGELEKLIRAHVVKEVPGFIERVTALGVTEEQARVLDAEAAVERGRRKMIADWRKANPNARGRRVKPKKPHEVDWQRPEFTEALKTYTFDTKDRTDIIRRVIELRNLVGAAGKASTLTGKDRAKADKLMAEVVKILAKNNLTIASLVQGGMTADSYRFDITDRRHVAIIARTIMAMDATAMDKVGEYYYSSLLSGLQTMIVNTTSVLNTAWQATVERGFEAFANLFFQNPDNATFSEFRYVERAMRPMLARSWSNAVATWSTEIPIFDEDVLNRPPDLVRLVQGVSGYRPGNIGGMKGRIIRTPTRILMATDNYLNTARATMEVGAQAYRMSQVLGMKPGSPEFDRFLKKQVNTPGSLAWQRAADKALQGTFMEPLPGQKTIVENPSGKRGKVPVRTTMDLIGAGVTAIGEALTPKAGDSKFHNFMRAIGKMLFFPFIRVPYNIMKQGAERTINPISLLDMSLLIGQSIRFSGGRFHLSDNSEVNQRMIENASKLLQGSLVFALLWGMSEGDDDDLEKFILITGSKPIKEIRAGERQKAYRVGIGPYTVSIKLPGGKRLTYHYGRIEPIATVLGGTVDTQRAIKGRLRGAKSGQEMSYDMINAWMAQINDKTSMRGMADMMALISQDRPIDRFVADRVAMVMPNLIRQIVRESDPYFRQPADTFAGMVKYGMWPAGQTPPRIDLYGEPERRPGAAAAKRMIDISKSAIHGEPNPADVMIHNWINRNGSKVEGISIPSVQRTTTYVDPIDGTSKQMTSGQKASYDELAGRYIRIAVKKSSLNIENPTPDDMKTMSRIVDNARAYARKTLLTNPKWRGLTNEPLTPIE